jgi:TonB family protein
VGGAIHDPGQARNFYPRCSIFSALSDLQRLSNLKSEELISMRKVIASAVFILMASAGLATAQNPSDTTGSGRKVVLRVAPVCPELARKMHIQGTVKLETIVRPNGNVKTTRVLGGNPVLVEAAKEAVAKWKFEAGPNETTEVVQLVFVTE